MIQTRTISTIISTTIVAAACLSTAPAMADDSGVYVGANIGRVLSTYRRTDLNNAETAALGGAANGFSLSSSSVRKDHVMWSADIGYMVSRNFGIEASYLNLGQLAYSSTGTLTASDGSGTTPVTVNVKIKSRGPALALVGALPMSNVWEIDARVGGYEGKTTSTYASAAGANSTSGRQSENSTSLLAGVGTGLTVSTHCTVRIDYLRLEHLREKAFDRSFNVDLVTAGINFVF